MIMATMPTMVAAIIIQAAVDLLAVATVAVTSQVKIPTGMGITKL